MRRVYRFGALPGLLLAGMALLAWPSSHAHAQPPPTTAPPIEDGGETDVGTGVTPGPPVTLPLVPVPIGCVAPPLPHVVFVGKVVDRDFRSAQFEIEQVRAGDPAPFSTDGRINVRYGLDAQYLGDGEHYVVSAPVDPDLGLLVSRITPVIQNFGGDEVIGVSESDVNCPTFDDPMRTVQLDGTPVEAKMLQPFFGARLRILGALATPLAVAFGVIFVLATFRLSISGLYHSITEPGRRRR